MSGSRTKETAMLNALTRYAVQVVVTAVVLIVYAARE